ncbi:hypothetical protein V8E36_005637 [Tilletia maclaganii]
MSAATTASASTETYGSDTFETSPGQQTEAEKDAKSAMLGTVSSAVRSAAAAPAVDFENRDEQDEGGTRLDFFADQERDRAQQGQSDRPVWLWLFELVLIWLNVVHFVSEKACVAFLEFGEAVAQQYDTTYGNQGSATISTIKLCKLGSGN